jgi:hypothetical protein
MDCLKIFRAILMHKNHYKNSIKWREREREREREKVTRKRLVFVGLIKGGMNLLDQCN